MCVGVEKNGFFTIQKDASACVERELKFSKSLVLARMYLHVRARGKHLAFFDARSFFGID